MSQSEPLAGVRVVTLAINLPGPLAVARLCALGASVVKVEPPAGDPLRFATPQWYDELAKGQRIVALDLKDPADRAQFDAELADAHLLVTSMRPSALRNLGLAELAKTHPHLSHVEIVGHDGPQAELPGHDLTYQAAHGTLVPPTMPTVPIVDFLGAERAVSAALLGLMTSTNSATGSHHRVVLEDAAEHAGAAVRYGLMGADAPLSGANPAYGIYATADGHVALAAIEPHFWTRTRAALGVNGTHEEIANVLATRTTNEWEEIAQRMDIPLAGIRESPRAETN
ncbi:CoA transferase [Rhodococcus sp. ABRD24]|uniref:CoA transferase n=1 Tax=Rhodococcus sp. ABRD24 TaxID=2507582 RepID=UPI00103A06EA|nr:CoA transferase [Rhodococcus sp. ABRD24]QBJ96472.1 CoA transferase [Rhodococcus sp. ABRD24]